MKATMTAAVGLAVTVIVLAAGPAGVDAAEDLTEAKRAELEVESLRLHQEGVRLYRDGKYAEALKRTEQSLEITERLYPKEKYPDGHPDLAASLANVGALLGHLGSYEKALVRLEESLRMNQKLYPSEKYPAGHPDIAASLTDLGSLLHDMGSHGKALACHEQALEMYRKLYPEEKYPDGHPDLARSLRNLSVLLQEIGSYEKALRYAEQALGMLQKLYPKEKYPNGHPDLARSLNDLGKLLWTVGASEKALSRAEEALEMNQQLYPKKKYPDGHPALAASLVNLGGLLKEMGSYEQALSRLEQGLEMCRKLYAKDRFPDGHPDIAASLNNVGTLLEAMGSYEKALSRYEEALEMWQKFYPKEKYPDGHPALAHNLNSLGWLLQQMGSYEKALSRYEEALEMWQKLYSKEKYPNGHRDLAISLSNMGTLLASMGSSEKAIAQYEQALGMLQKLYPRDQYPDGHPDLATILNALGVLLQAMGAYEKALERHEQALDMRQKLYPNEKYPNGHPALARSLTNLSAVLQQVGAEEKAMGRYEQAIEMYRKLYPREQYPAGHPNLSATLNNGGLLLEALGTYEKALSCHEQALEMNQKLYPKTRYPDGHPSLAGSLINLGNLWERMGSHEKALAFLTEAARLSHRQMSHRLPLLADSDAMWNLQSTAVYRDSLLTTTRHLPDQRAAAYPHVWDSKATFTRTLQFRQFAAHASNDASVRQTWSDYLALRRRLEQVLRSPLANSREQDRLLRSLNMEKNSLEEKLVRDLPLLPRQKELDERSPTDLAKILPADSIFLDLIRYRRFEQDPKIKGRDGQKWTLCYTAFVLAKDQQPVRVELGPAQDINLALAKWRLAIESWSLEATATARADLQRQEQQHAATLRKLLWEPLAKHLPEGTKRIYVSPDADLWSLPWAALPGSKPDTILLEEYTLALVPHGPFLLEQLLYPRKYPDGKPSVLSVGAVTYDVAGQKPVAGYPRLPGTARELEQIRALVGERTLTTLEGDKATVAELTKQLPNARFAHLATHGFFNEADLEKERKRLEEYWKDWRRQMSLDMKPVGLGMRNPLGYVGLVLAGANHPDKAPDGGILSGLRLAEIRLDGMQLVVLSACETGSGQLTAGEGVEGLQRAFHLAGCANVVASLWKVNDTATAALMAKFYHELWQENKDPVEALREAQLLVYRRPDLLKDLEGERGAPKLKEAVKVEGSKAGEPKEPVEGLGKRTPTKLWAAFVLSGLGR